MSKRPFNYKEWEPLNIGNGHDSAELIRESRGGCESTQDTADPRCASCGVPYREHLGLAGTCAGLVAAKVRIATLERLVREAVPMIQLLENYDSVVGGDHVAVVHWLAEVKEILK